jgi:hypothetical protein
MKQHSSFGLCSSSSKSLAVMVDFLYRPAASRT